ncbi:hypothetical protein NMQ01_06220 [Janibacter sp. CX7]|uniref:hypothetical protein n=1 Tax=Janibacter sp. CX7 TaxID=2963431 RepID=UPI0020CD9A55|nr:hypothetical protein [Janibacter sp. CX7]UTT67305.1 hypothetical protein NMQ01_06220 [Janibacter sp. CX7]
MTDGLRSGLGTGELAALAQRVLDEWRRGSATRAEQMEVCDCCGDWVDVEHPRDREMADQWREATAERARMESLRSGSGPGWPGPEIVPDDAVTGWTGSRAPEWCLDELL